MTEVDVTVTLRRFQLKAVDERILSTKMGLNRRKSIWLTKIDHLATIIISNIDRPDRFNSDMI